MEDYPRFKIGDKVEALETKNFGDDGKDAIHRGQIYTVKKIYGDQIGLEEFSQLTTPFAKRFKLYSDSEMEKLFYKGALHA